VVVLPVGLVFCHRTEGGINKKCPNSGLLQESSDGKRASTGLVDQY